MGGKNMSEGGFTPAMEEKIKMAAYRISRELQNVSTLLPSQNSQALIQLTMQHVNRIISGENDVIIGECKDVSDGASDNAASAEK